MKYKNQHWIPDSYLRAWCDIETPNEAWVWRVAIKDLTITRKSPKSLFSDEDFYTAYDKDNNRILALEHELQSIENNFITLRNDKLQKHIKLDPIDRKTIALFTSTMFARTKRQKEDGKKIWRDYIQMVDDLPPSISRLIKNRQDYKDVIQMHRNQPMLFHLFQFVNATAPYLFHLNCAIYETKSSPGIITSDNPCIWFDPAIYNPNIPLTYFGVGSPTLNVILPISPTQYISLERQGPDGYRNLNKDSKTEKHLVDTINRMIVLNSDEYIVVNKRVVKERWFKD